MPYRTLTLSVLLYGVVGLLVLGALLLLRRDLRREAGTGPRWKRRLVAAALLLLAWCSAAASQRAGVPVPAGASELSRSDTWRHFAGVWRTSEELASLKRGGYPFNVMGKWRTLRRLDSVGADLDRLQRRGEISHAEAGLLRAEQARLTERIQGMRTREESGATCYLGVRVRPVDASMGRLCQRLPLLEKLAGSGALHPEVLARTVDTVERDAETLRVQERFLRNPEELAAARQLRTSVRAQIARIHQRLRPSEAGLEAAPGWQVVIQGLEGAGPLTRRNATATVIQHGQVEAGLDAACREVDALVAAGMLCADEGQILRSHSERLRAQLVLNNSPVPLSTAQPGVPAAGDLIGRLSTLLPPLRRLAANGKMHPAVLALGLPQIEADLWSLRRPPNRYYLPPADQGAASRLVADLDNTLADLNESIWPRE